MTFEEKQSIKKEIFDPYEHIDMDSFPSTPNTENRSLDQYFDNDEQYFLKRRHSNEFTKHAKEK